MKCKECGADNQDGYFCMECGAGLKNDIQDKTDTDIEKQSLFQQSRNILGTVCTEKNIINKIIELFPDPLKGFLNKYSKILILGIIVVTVIVTSTVNVICNNVKRSKNINDYIKSAEVSINQKNYKMAERYIDEILRIDSDNKEGLQLKAELEPLLQQEKFDELIASANELKMTGDYIGAYEKIESALKLISNDSNAIAMKNEIKPLADEQKQVLEQKNAEQEAARQKREQENRDRIVAENAEKEAKRDQDIKQLIDLYVFDGELAAKIVRIYSYAQNISGDTYQYSAISNDEKGSYYNIARKSQFSDMWQMYKVYNDGTVQTLTWQDKVSGYTTATFSESERKKTEQDVQSEQNIPNKKNNKETPKSKSDFKLYYGDGYAIEYPSHYQIIENDAMLTIFSDITPFASVTVGKTDEYGDLSSWTKADYKAYFIDFLGTSFDIIKFSVDSTDYGCKLEATLTKPDGSFMSHKIMQSGNYSYVVMAMLPPNMSDDDSYDILLSYETARIIK